MSQADTQLYDGLVTFLSGANRVIGKYSKSVINFHCIT